MPYETNNFSGNFDNFADFGFGFANMVIAIIVLSVVCSIFLLAEIVRHVKRMSELEKRLKALEDANRKRMPYQSQEELIDAMTAISFYLQERKIQDTFIENAAGHITNALAVGTKREKGE